MAASGLKPNFDPSRKKETSLHSVAPAEKKNVYDAFKADRRSVSPEKIAGTKGQLEKTRGGRPKDKDLQSGATRCQAGGGKSREKWGGISGMDWGLSEAEK